MAEKDVVRPENLETLRGLPKKLYKLVKADLLTDKELDGVHELAFGVAMDFEDDLHTQMLAGCMASKKRQYEADKEARDRETSQNREAARTWLRANYPGVNADLTPEGSLDQIHASLVKAADDPTVTIVSTDEDELCLVTEDGEVIGFADAPRDDIDRRNILEWVGERITTSQARQAGIEAEKAFWLAKIGKQFDPKINKQKRIQDRLEYLYTPVGQAYLDEIRAKNKSKKEIKSVKIGMITLAYTLTRASTTVEDDSKAITFCEQKFPEAVKVVKSILVSNIPDMAKAKLDRTTTGIYFYPGGDNKFSLK